MLSAATKLVDERASAYVPPVTFAVSQSVEHRPIVPSRYARQSRLNVPVIAAIVIAHILILAAVIQARTHRRHVREEALTVVNLSPPPPPPAAPSTPPPPAAPQVVAPPPIVQTPIVRPPIQTTPEITPVPVVDARPAPPSAVPSARAAPPAPPSIVQGGDLGAQMVSGKPPRYPIDSRRKREQGTVVLALTLSFDGAVETIALTQSSGFKRLDDAARDAVRSWRWKPVLLNGQPMRVKGLVEIPFVLRADS